MDISCELPKLSCLKKPSKSDIDKLKEANIAPNKLIDSIFSDLDKTYNTIKKQTKTKTRSKTKGGRRSLKSMRSKSMRSKSMRSKSMRSKKNTKRKMMFGGELTKYQKDKITDMVILLVAGGSYWTIVPIIDAWIISIGILPKLCGQNMMEHITSNIFSAEGQSCSSRAQRYNTIMSGFVTLITGSAWYARNKFTKENLSKNYNKIHHLVKKKLFGPSETPTPPSTPTPSPSPPKEESRAARPETARSRQGETARSRHQERQYEDEEHYDQDDSSRGNARRR
jgi:hypothetical protein